MSSSSPSAPATSPVDPGPAALSISTLGQFRLERHNLPGTTRRGRRDSIDTNWQQRPVRALLGYLLCCPDRRASREQIRTALWLEDDETTARSQLNKAANALRKLLGHPTIEGGQDAASQPLGADGWLFQMDSEELVLAPQERIWMDADAFDACVSRLRSDHSQNGDQRELALREAIALYRGDFLVEERDAEWVVARRQELRRNWIELQLEMADLCVQREDFAATIKVLDSLLAKDPTNESAIQRLIIVLARSRRRIEALHAYKRFEEALQREFKAVPASDTRALYDAIREGRELPVLSKSSSQADEISTISANAASTSPLDSVADTPSSSRMDARVHRLFASVSLENSMRPHQSALIGRDSELGLMQKMLYDVENLASRPKSKNGGPPIPLDTQRRPQFLFLMGDSGIGKTRLAEEVSREAQQRRWAVVWSRLYEQESGIPYRAWTEPLRKILNMNSSLLNAESVQPLATLLPELAEVMPQMLRDKAVPSYMPTPEQERQRLWDVIVNMLKEMSEATSLLLVLDDIQWADSSSQDLLGYLVRHLYGYPILFVSTCRDSALPTDPHHPLRELVSHMQRERNIQTIKVEPLTTEQIEQLVTSFPSLPEETVRHIKDYAAGNPLFAEEMARTTPPTLPRTVMDAMKYRMKRLSSDCRNLLGRAAVLGGSFEFPLICAMESRGDLDDEDTVLTLLEEALQEGVLTDEGSGTRVTYHFWHPLMVSYLYTDLSTVRRARLHQRAADAFLSTYHGREESVAATVTDHLEKAGAAPARIAHYAELAGNNAYMVSAYSEAAYYYQRAASYLQHSLSPDSQLQLISLLERLAECTRIRGNYPEARQLYERVLDLRRQNQALTTDSQQEAQVQALLWDEIAWTWRYTGDIARAWECFQEGEHILRVAGVIGGPAWGRLYYTQSNLYQAEGHYDQALSSAEAALVLLEAQQTYQKQASPLAQSSRSSCKGLIQRTLEGDPVNLGRTYRHMGSIAVAMGQLTQALAHQRKALALYEQYDEMRQIAHVSSNIGHIYLKKAEYVQAQAALRRSFNLAEHISDDPLISLIYYNQAELAAATGDLEEAERLYRSALDLEERFQDLEYISKWNSGLAAIVQERGKLTEAVQCIKRALSAGRKMQNDPCIGQALVALGNLRITQALSLGCSDQPQRRLLAHAQTNIQRALALSSLDVETRLRGQLATAHIALVLNDRDTAFSALEQVIAEAQRHELAQIVARALQLQESA
jgi:predicted ATPase/DNA-binding SARP family transcriptional activator